MKNSAILKQLGSNIKTCRNDLKISQEQLSFTANLDRSYIGSVERGERNVSLINVCKIASALQTTPSVLLEGISLSLENNTNE